MHLLATIDVPKKRGTRLVKDESSSKVVSLHMINFVRHDKKLNNTLLLKPNLQQVKRWNVIPTPSYTTTNMGEDGVAYVESGLQWLWYV